MGKPLAHAEGKAYIEDVRPQIRQKGDIITVKMDFPLRAELWDRLGRLIGKDCEITILECSPVQPELVEDGEEIEPEVG